MKTYIMTDIHGQYYALQKALDIVNIKKDRLFILGDYVDRGDDSRKVLDFVMQNNIDDSDKAGIHCLVGNHDIDFCTMLETASFGVMHTPKRYIKDLATILRVRFFDVTDEYISELIHSGYMKFLRTLPVCHILEDPFKIVLVHASIKKSQVICSGIPWSKLHQHDVDNMVWEREEFFEQPAEKRKGDTQLRDYTIIIGHTPILSFEGHIPTGYRVLSPNKAVSTLANHPIYSPERKILMMDTGGVFEKYDYDPTCSQGFYTLLCLDDSCYYKITRNKETEKIEYYLS